MSIRSDNQSYLSVNWQNPVDHNHALNNGLSAWWLNVPHWQGGTVLRDLLGRLNGVATGQFWKGPDTRGLGSLTFDGGDGSERVTFPFASHIDVTRNETFSVSMWIKPSAFAGTQFASMLMWGTWRWTLGLADDSGAGDGKLECWFNNSDFENSATAVPLDVWTWVGITTDGTTLTFFQNGIADGTATHNAITDADDPLGIGGKHNGSSDSAYAGDLDDIRIYLGKKLSLDEMYRLYLASRAGNFELLNRLRVPQYSEQAAVGADIRNHIIPAYMRAA